MTAVRDRARDTAAVMLPPRCPVCRTGFLVDVGGTDAGVRCMVERDAGADGLALETRYGYQPSETAP